ncbi:MFS transporter [Fredinandcohnia onubensis]|uniref:MFS transporter n=1 Tax=Fredinandcohnia onubensis TaxID=1571209 RepID=UPI000C0BE42B|nr:MFS transporter [Fredinandcohnia onubensis]
MIYKIVGILMLIHISYRANILLISLYALSLEANAFELGIIISAGSLFPMLFAVWVGRLSDQYGYKILLVFGSFLGGLSLFIPFVFQGNITILIITQVLFGIAYIFVLVTTQNLVGHISSKENRLKNFFTNGLSISLAGFIGPLIAGVGIDEVGYQLTFLILTLLCFICGILIVLNMIPFPETNVQQVEINTGNRFELLTHPGLRKIYLISAIVLTGVGLYEFYFPIYGEFIKLSATSIGIIISMNAIAYYIIRLFMPMISSRYSESVIISSCFLVSGLCFVLIPFTNSFIILMIISFCLGLGIGCAQPLTINMAYNSSPEGRTGEVLGLRISINKGVQFVVPILFGLIGTKMGFIPIFASVGILFLTLLFVTAKMKNKRFEQDFSGNHHA